MPARLPFVDASDASEPVREALDAVPAPLALFRMVAHADTAFAPWLRYGATLLAQLELDPLLRELAILQVAKLAESSYEWVQHTGITRAVGGSEEQIAAVEAGEVDAAAFTAEQSAVLRLTRSMVSEGAGTEAQVHDLEERLGPRALVELLLVIGHYLAIARLIATLDLEPDPPIDPSAMGAAEEAG